MTWRFLTSGESHGRGLLVIAEGLPAGLAVSKDFLDGVMARRRRGFGRGERKNVERDEITLWGGIRGGMTTGGPVGITIGNAEWESWDCAMTPWAADPAAVREKAVTAPRPGHADLSGGIKFNTPDMRNILERASARTTAPRTLAGALAALVLAELGVTARSAVQSIGGVGAALPSTEEEWEHAASSDLGVAREEDEPALKRRIELAAKREQALGYLRGLGYGPPAGIGSFTEWDRRLDGRLAGAVMAVPAIKEWSSARALPPHSFGPGRARPYHGAGRAMGRRPTGQAVSRRNGTGCEIRIRAAMKPISTMKLGLPSLRYGIKQARCGPQRAQRRLRSPRRGGGGRSGRCLGDRGCHRGAVRRRHHGRSKA